MDLLSIMRANMQANVWCSPGQDYQYNFRPARLTNSYGVSRTFQAGRRTVKLPTVDFQDRYLIYSLPIFVDYTNLPEVRNIWLNATGMIGFNNLMIDVYTESGLQFPRHLVWCYMLDNSQVLLAIKKQDGVNFFENESLYLKLYQNAYFTSDQVDVDDGMECKALTVQSTQDALDIQTAYYDWLSRKGNVLAWINGILVEGINYQSLELGDCVDIVWDSSIYQIINFDVSDLSTFMSTLDNQQKYVIHPDKWLDSNTIDYYDDITVYMIKQGENDTKGVYYHRKDISDLRMLTHRDYSIPTSNVLHIRQQHSYWNSNAEVTLRFHFRRSGRVTPLILEGSRLNNLYEMDDDGILGAMVGINSNIEEWQAANLETSIYCQAMALTDPYPSQEFLQDLYQYHGLAEMVAKSIFKMPENGIQVIPPAFRAFGTAYEYSGDRKLLGVYWCESSTGYSRQNPTGTYVEFMIGRGTSSTRDYINTPTVPRSQNSIWRVYRLPIVNYKHDGTFEDISLSDRITSDSTDIHIADIDPETEIIICRQDDRYLSYQLTLDPSDEILEFTVNTLQYVEGEFITAKNLLPYSQNDLFLNGSELIEGIHYTMQWPRITLHTRDFYNPDGDNVIVLRSYGMLDVTQSQAGRREVGFVKDGYLSRNGVRNVRKGQLLKYSVDGQMYMSDELSFGDVATERMHNTIQDGSPYVVKEYIHPIRGIVGVDVYDYYRKSLAFTRKIEAYLSLKIPQPELPPVVDNILPLNPVMASNVNLIAEVTGSDYRTMTFPSGGGSIEYDLNMSESGVHRVSFQVKGSGKVDVSFKDVGLEDGGSADTSIVEVITLKDGYRCYDYTIYQIGNPGRLSLNVYSTASNVVSIRGLMVTSGDMLSPYNALGEEYIFDRTELFSPLLTRVWYDLINGHIDEAIVNGPLSDSTVINTIKDFERFSTVDPVHSDIPEVSTYCRLKCFPSGTTRNVTVNQKRFLDRVNKVYFGEAYALSAELHVVSGD